MLICLLYVSFDEVYVQIFCTLFNWIVHLLILSFTSYFHVLTVVLTVLALEEGFCSQEAVIVGICLTL